MSAGTFQFDQLRALNQDKKTISEAYTVRTGRTTDDFVIDNPVVVADPTAEIIVTIPDGIEIGQKLLIVMSSRATAVSAVVTVTHHSGGDAGTEDLDLADEYMYFMWTGTEWVTLSYSTAGDIA